MGFIDGISLGRLVVRRPDGSFEEVRVGLPVGDFEGDRLIVGRLVGLLVGDKVGNSDGVTVGE